MSSSEAIQAGAREVICPSVVQRKVGVRDVKSIHLPLNASKVTMMMRKPT